MNNFGGFVSGQTSTLWTFTALLTVFAWTLVEGQTRVIGPLTVKAAPGENVTLPCHVEPEYDVQGLTIEWSKPDLKKDPTDPRSGVKYVLLYRFKREVPQVKIRSYVGRTSLSPDSLKRGDVSLQILNLTLEDQGRYRCYIPLLKSRVREVVIQLEVDPNLRTTEPPMDTRTSNTPETTDENLVRRGRSHHGVWISFTLVLFLSVGVLYLCRYNQQGQKSCKNLVPEDKSLTV
ncbi:myelin-oligodendrocyte glycoprotein-like [Halichoeres trimaculatus]|uniref:myelin-oligodendrocyte glycoprotein-like n=1 Tax=Halichoeres trimaculatus TaxID=147232 RepID=UPI003D9ED2F0